MLPKPIPSISDEAAKRFEKQDKEPLSSEEKAFLKKCLEVYDKHPIEL